MMKRPMRMRSVIGLLGAAALLPALAFDINEDTGLKWPGARTTIFTAIPGTAASGVRWQDALIDAADEWSTKTRFTFDISPGYRDPCIGYNRSNDSPTFGGGDGLNGNDFAETVCGADFSGSTLAVALVSSQANRLGGLDIVEADVVYNGNLTFDIYDGPLTSGNERFAGFDFRRIALHELGHVLGLEHETDRSIPAIMAPSIGDLFRLQADDIAGANTLYAGIEACESRVLLFGRVDDELAPGDCRISDLMAGGTDDSLVDVYELDIPRELTVSLEMDAGALDGVLVLTDTGLRVLQMDEQSAGSCDPLIRRELQAGRYVVLANTYTGEPPCAEATQGPYRLTATYRSDQLLSLSGQSSFQGGSADAQFFGGVTIDGGNTFSNRVSPPTQPFDVEGRIVIDPVHIGQPGFLVIAAVIDDGETLIRNRDGEFVTYRPATQQVPIAREKVLESVEVLDILTGMVAADLGIEDIEVNFYIGYGVDSNPDELYFHSEPINLLVE